MGMGWSGPRMAWDQVGGVEVCGEGDARHGCGAAHGLGLGWKC